MQRCDFLGTLGRQIEFRTSVSASIDDDELLPKGWADKHEKRQKCR